MPSQLNEVISWHETAAKRALVDYVENVTRTGSPDFVPEAERIAVFDNDGTLWPENPMPFQLAFVFDELDFLAPQHPEWKDDPVVQAALKEDIRTLLQGGLGRLLKLVGLTHAGITTTEFGVRVETWLANAKHPRFGTAYTETIYQPMLDVFAYLRARRFKTFIVSAGGVDFMRVWSERTYGVPPEQVVGSTTKSTFELRAGNPVLVKTIGQVFVNDGPGKPVAVHEFIGRRPIACFGNSDGDHALLQYTTIGNPRASFGLIAHHTDAEREYAYDAVTSSTGKLVDALGEAPRRGWTVVDMRADWRQIFAFEKKSGLRC